MTEKDCFKCKETKPLSEFYKHSGMSDGYLGKCKVCAKADVKFNRLDKAEYYRAYDRKRYREDPVRRESLFDLKNHPNRAQWKAKGDANYKRKYPERYEARVMVGNAVRDGRLIRPDKCSKCGVECTPQAHHESYEPEHWLDVAWLCVKCHCDRHNVLREKARH